MGRQHSMASLPGGAFPEAAITPHHSSDKAAELGMGAFRNSGRSVAEAEQRGGEQQQQLLAVELLPQHAEGSSGTGSLEGEDEREGEPPVSASSAPLLPHR